MNSCSPSTPGADLARWSALCRQLGAESGIEAAYRELVGGYQAPERVYHNLAHVASCLREADALHRLAVHPEALEFALWYHDAVYDPRAKDNEARSAALALAALVDMRIGGDIRSRVESLILATRHDRPATTDDEAIIIDVDLAILGQAAEVFDRYEAGVRAEYSWLSDSEFWPKRAEFLAALLARKHIFITSECRQKYEVPARQNLQRSIASARHRFN